MPEIMPEILNDLLSNNYKIYFDTCSLMQPSAWPYIAEVLIPALKTGGASVIVPIRVLEELRKLKNKEGDTGTLASSGLEAVALLLGSGVLELSGGESDTFVDNYFLYTFTRQRLQHNLSLITQDRKLALDVHGLENHRSVQMRKKILLLKIEKGVLVEWELNGSHDTTSVTVKRKAKLQVSTVPRMIGDMVKDEVISVGKTPTTGDTVSFPKYGKFVLGTRAAKTPNGDIYHASRGMACVIYSPETVFQPEKFKKLEKMLQMPVSIKGVCWPLDMVRVKGVNDEFVSCLMPGFAGGPMDETIFSNVQIKENFPHWTRKELAEVCLTTIKKIKKLHDINVLVGNISPSNIFVKSEKEVYFIEADTCQVEDFPGPHTSMDFIAPELRGEKNGAYYDLATLLFMILLPGRHPFSAGAGSGPDDRVRLQKFPYPLGESGSRYTPGVPWKYIWSNLPYRIKHMFCSVFIEGAHISPCEWTKAFQEYLLLLGNGYINNEIFPSQRKIINPCEVACARCGAKETQERKWIENLIAEGKIYLCEACLEKLRRGKDGGASNGRPKYQSVHRQSDSPDTHRLA